MKGIFCGNLEFDAYQSDVERLFRKYGRVDRVDMKSGEFAFSLPKGLKILHLKLKKQTAAQTQSAAARWSSPLEVIRWKKLRGKLFWPRCKIMDRVISVEYAIRDDNDKRNGFSPDRRGRDMSPDRRNYGRGHSPNECRRDRDSRDYGRGSVPNPRSEQRESPDYNRAQSPAKDKYRSRSPCERSPSQE